VGFGAGGVLVNLNGSNPRPISFKTVQEDEMAVNKRNNKKKKDKFPELLQVRLDWAGGFSTVAPGSCLVDGEEVATYRLDRIQKVQRELIDI
jgi:hypothetical protein